MQGNRNWALARGPLFRSPLLPDFAGSVAAGLADRLRFPSLDNMLEVLLVGGLDPMHAMRVLVPRPGMVRRLIDSGPEAFYEYYSMHMEPWDGPAGIVLTDGRYAAVRWTATACAPRAV